MVRLKDAGQHPQQGGFTAAVPAHQADDLTLSDGEGDAVEGLKVLHPALFPVLGGALPLGHRDDAPVAQVDVVDGDGGEVLRRRGIRFDFA